MGVLGLELRSSAKAISAFDPWHIPPAPNMYSFKVTSHSTSLCQQPPLCCDHIPALATAGATRVSTSSLDF